MSLFVMLVSKPVWYNHLVAYNARNTVAQPKQDNTKHDGLATRTQVITRTSHASRCICLLNTIGSSASEVGSSKLRDNIRDHVMSNFNPKWQMFEKRRRDRPIGEAAIRLRRYIRPYHHYVITTNAARRAWRIDFNVYKPRRRLSSSKAVLLLRVWSQRPRL